MEKPKVLNDMEELLCIKATLNNIPINTTLELTPLCNMSCDMCYIHLTREEMNEQGSCLTLEEWLKIAEELKRMGTLFILLTGGEPLLYPNFKELYLSLQKMGFIITVNTNGTLIDEEMAEFFSKNSPRRINITLYGADEEMYTSLCHSPGAFNKVIKALSLLQQKSVPIKLNGSTVKKNKDQQGRIIEIAKRFNIPIEINTYMYPCSRRPSISFDNSSRLSPEEAAILDIEYERYRKGREFEPLKKKLIEKYQYYLTHNIQPENITHSCRAAKSSCWINWKGRISPCVFLESPSYDLKGIDIETAWRKLVEDFNKITLSSKCTSCPKKEFCKVCAACSLWETGSFDGTPEYMCRFSDTFISKLKEESI